MINARVAGDSHVERKSSDLLGPRASRPQMSAKRENVINQQALKICVDD
jgi:hypothetical protein